MSFARVNDISVYYEVHGDNGSPVILIAGLGGTSAGWGPGFLARMAASHRVIACDNRGAGQSDQPTSPYTMAGFASDTVGLLDALGIDKAHVVGPSMGGMIAQHVAIRYPDRVVSLTLGCTCAGVQHVIWPDEKVVAQLVKPPSGDAAQDIRDSWPIFWAPVFIEANRPLLEDWLRLQLCLPPQPAYAYQLQADSTDTHDASDEQLGRTAVRHLDFLARATMS